MKKLSVSSKTATLYTIFLSDERWYFYKSYVSVLVIHQLILVLLSVRRVAGGRLYCRLVDETEPLQLVGRCQEHLLETHADTKLVVDEPDLVNLYDGHYTLTLLQTVRSQLQQLTVRVVRLGGKVTVGTSHHLQLQGRGVLTLAWSHRRLVQCLLHDLLVVLLAQAGHRVGVHKVNHLVIQLLELGGNLGVVQRQAQGVGRLAGRRVGVSAQAVGCTELRELEEELRVTDAVQVHHLAAHRVLANSREGDIGSRKVGDATDSEGSHCSCSTFHTSLCFKSVVGSMDSRFFCVSSVMDANNQALVKAVHVIANKKLQAAAKNISAAAIAAKNGDIARLTQELEKLKTTMTEAGQAARVANAVPVPVNAATNMSENQATKNVAGYIAKISTMSYNNLNGLNNQGRNNIRNAIAARKQKISNNVTALMGEIGSYVNVPTLNAVKNNIRYKSASNNNRKRINTASANKRSNLTTRTPPPPAP